MYLSIYNKLCKTKSQLKEHWIPGSGLHRHHIIPTHSGGTDDELNFTYLTVREHTIAHFLLWKIHRNPNDLRSMKMLGANLSPIYRRIIGEYCRDNKIGMFSDKFTRENRAEWINKGIQTQIRNKTGIHNPENFSKYASMGGKLGSKSQITNKVGIHDPSNFKKNAFLGGKAIKGMICVSNGSHRTRIKPEKLETYLAMGYKKGFKLSS